MGLLDTDKLARIVQKATKGPLLYAVTVHKRAAGYDADGVPNGAETSTSVLGCVLEFSSYRRQVDAIPDTDVEILIAQHGAAVSPVIGDEITARSVRYQAMAVRQDPARATWSIQGRPV